jgi:Na+-driven multidrug efflux pump
VSGERLSYRDTFFLWLPLALSWTMMSIAGPVANAGIARLPEPAVNLAAHGLTMSIAVLIESPIIMILSTSVSLVRSRTSYLLLRRFVTHLSIALTVISALVYYTPLYDLLFLRMMGVPPEVADAARPALRVMLLWPAAIGWRRLFQGILIRRGQSKLVSLGTMFRLASLTAMVMLGVSLRLSPGALVGGLAMAVSVIVEMLVIAWWTLPVVREQVLPVSTDPETAEPLDYGRLLRFYLPLAGTDAMRVLSRPITTAGIARAPQATLSLATWPVASGLSMLTSSSVMALQEVVVARAENEETRRRLRSFSAAVGVAFSVLLSLVVVTPVARWYYRALLGVPADVEALALSNLPFLLPMPLLFAGRNFMRGVLISQRQSGLVQLGMFINLLALVGLLVAGAQSGLLHGVTVAIVATVLAEAVEVVSLWLLSRRQPKAQMEPKASAAL